jgi:hypothetical protein
MSVTSCLSRDDIKRMESMILVGEVIDTSDVGSRHARAGSDRDEPGFGRMLFFERRYNGPQEQRLPGTCQGNRIAINTNTRHKKRRNKDALKDGKEKTQENVPAEPVKNTFFPSLTTAFITLTCSSLSTTSRDFSSPSPVTPSRPDPSRTETLGEKNVSIVNLGCFALRAPGGAP